MIRALFEGDFKYVYWAFMNRVFGAPKGRCLCTMREECQECWTKFQESLKHERANLNQYAPEPKIDVKAIERKQIFK